MVPPVQVFWWCRDVEDLSVVLCLANNILLYLSLETQGHQPRGRSREGWHQWQPWCPPGPGLAPETESFHPSSALFTISSLNFFSSSGVSPVLRMYFQRMLYVTPQNSAALPWYCQTLPHWSYPLPTQWDLPFSVFLLTRARAVSQSSPILSLISLSSTTLSSTLLSLSGPGVRPVLSLLRSL